MAIEVTRARRLFTVDEYDRMGEAGIFGPEERVELIEGEIVEMSPIGDRHAACVMNLIRLFIIGLTNRAVVSPQNPVRIPTRSKPQPDLTVLRPRSYINAGATVDDVLLIVEVADTSLGYDRTVKLRLYARACIPEYWLVDANTEWLDVYRTPASDGYRAFRRIARQDRISPLAFPDLFISVADIFA